MKKYNKKAGSTIIKIFTKGENDGKVVDKVLQQYPDEYIEWWPFSGSTLNRSEFLCYIGEHPELIPENLPIGLRCDVENELKIIEVFAIA